MAAKVDVHSLSRKERLDLLGELWDSLNDEAEPLPLTAAQRKELDRRLDDLDRDPRAVIPWQEVLERIRRSLA
ncbi:MAG: addiction module protein [Planctomycetota bacterium]